jgi:hypothetical protein
MPYLNQCLKNSYPKLVADKEDMKQKTFIFPILVLILTVLACQSAKKTMETPAIPETPETIVTELTLATPTTLVIPTETTVPSVSTTSTEPAAPIANPPADLTVPEKYQQLFDSIKNQLDNVESSLAKIDSPVKKPVVFSAELITADSNRGEGLLAEQTLKFSQLYLDRLQAIGVTGVKISVQYPLLTPDFPNYEKYLAFFKKIAGEVRSRNMTLTVQASILFANTPFSNLTVDYSGLTFTEFLQKDRQMVETILKEMQPDYLILIGEPDTAVTLTGLKEFNDPQKINLMLDTLTESLPKGKTLIGAGAGTWSPPAIFEVIAKHPGVDFVSLHVYPMSAEILASTLQAAEIARNNQKKVIFSEAWLYKTDIPRGGDHVANSEAIFRLDTFSFWTPLDQQFIKLMTELARKTDADLVSFFWSPYLFNTLDYAPADDMLPSNQLRRLSNKAAVDALLNGQVSEIGKYLSQTITQYNQ